ncbi:MAG: Fe-S cluster assembly protein SufB [Meiothermus sp.]|uniref:Fe-S cluster assembly protein SufB n=1 Tax=Meiothermus sp. TaxID=1955249 RepID=UPI0025FBFF7F|nr:Fe-S cluster assembly protein SufB [Meiothermus sp.]MCS7195587.1 Fe-S cluster assembly protein SufB [Meiothermus sp.]MDW8091461.1 Fe-S cluster assembly protein SufB [Meiothermus sp.]
MSENFLVEDIGNEYKYGFVDEVQPVWKAEKGLSRRVVEAISYHKEEPAWMLQFRLKALEIYQAKPVPTWGADLSGLNMDEIYFYAKPTEKRDAQSWDEVPEAIRRTYERLGIPEAERRVLAGVGAQYDSEMVYHQVREELKRQGVIFVSIEEGLKHYEDLFREYFATVVPPEDNKYAALNSAVWSGGSFVYVPKGVKVELPLQAYFRVNTAELGQFERTLIIVDEGAEVHYIEGCTAPVYTTDSFHSGVIEIVVNQGARSRYTTIQNWPHNMYNLVTQRAIVKKDAYHMWLDGNLGSKVTMKYPSSYLVEEGARSDILSIAFANTGQHQDAGGKLIFAASHTGGSIVSKSISKGSGRSSYRGLIKVYEGAKHVKVNVECDALLINEESRTDTYPYMEIEDDTATVGHEATVSRLNDEQIFYLQSRGLPEDEAAALIVRGFIEPVAKELPLEYAVELNRLIELEMEGSVG